MSLPVIVGVAIALLGVLGGLGAFILGWLKRKPEQEALISQAAENAVAAISETLAALRTELQEAQKSREVLIGEIGRLRRRVSELEFEIIGLRRELMGVNDITKITPPQASPPSD